MDISAPFNAQPSNAYQPIAGGYRVKPGAEPSIPTLSAWQKATQGVPRAGVIARIDDCLRLYNTGNGWDRLALLGDLYFCTDYGLRHAPNDQVMNSLYLSVVDRLCKAFDCTPNFLPQRLEECWGRVLTKHGREVDQPPTNKKGEVLRGAQPAVADYLQRTKVELYKISFRNGRAYMRDRTKYTTWVPADSRRIGWTYHPAIQEQMMEPGYAGFALSMDRRLYMAHHRGGFHKHNFFHSSYLSGDAVLCTGTILIEGGVVKGIDNSSGHYKPSLEHLVNVLETLRMHGCDTSKTNVWATPYSWKKDGILQLDWFGPVLGTELLNDRGGGRGLYQRMVANRANITKITGEKGALADVDLPGRRAPSPPPPRNTPPPPPGNRYPPPPGRRPPPLPAR